MAHPGSWSVDMPVVPEVSVVMPCLNEVETLGSCIAKARQFLEGGNVAGEIVVADNGSCDGSRELAARCGVRVVQVSGRGYGLALRGGVEATRGRYVIMGDADDSYDFSTIGPFLDKLREGADLVMGNRFHGGIRRDSMPPLHRWFGNPVLSAIGRLFFGTGVGDFHCGLRGFSRAAFEKMDLHSAGMEFASEMVIKASMLGLRIAEVPTVLHPDGRSRSPHLRTWRDGWRHLRLMLLYSPRWLFLVPGATMLATGAVGMACLAPRSVAVGSVEFGIHTMLVAGLACIVGMQLLVFAAFTKALAIRDDRCPESTATRWLAENLTIERGAVAGLFVAGVGCALVLLAVVGWERVGFGELDPRVSMRRLIPGVVLTALGIQMLFSSFFLGQLAWSRE